MILAITGGTGFVGRRLIELALADGHQLRALTRRSQPVRSGVAWIEGALDNASALARLVEGSDAVIHVAGVVNTPDRAGFEAGNVAGTKRMVEAALGAGIGRFVHVSSLAAREPTLSLYGWSKAASEHCVHTAGIAWTIVRPPAVYGPGDMEMLDTFRLAKRGIALTPPAGRMSVIHVDDLARLLIALATSDAHMGDTLEPDDGRAGGWSSAEFLGPAIGAAVGTRPLTIALPRPLLTLAARADRLLRGPKAKLSADRVGYMCHPDWSVDPARRPAPIVWQPQIDTPTGLAQTAAWYRGNGLL